MQIDPNANIEAFTRLGDKTGQVQAQVSMGVLKESLDNAESNMMQLMQSMQPHIGQNVDIQL